MANQCVFLLSCYYYLNLGFPMQKNKTSGGGMVKRRFYFDYYSIFAFYPQKNIYRHTKKWRKRKCLRKNRNDNNIKRMKKTGEKKLEKSSRVFFYSTSSTQALLKQEKVSFVFLPSFYSFHFLFSILKKKKGMPLPFTRSHEEWKEK